MKFHIGHRANATPSWMIIIAGLLMSIPLWLHKGEVELGADIQYHLLWTEQFSKQLWSGELYPRWLANMNDGLGSPTFFFYPPIPFYVAAIFYPITLLTSVPWFATAAGATLALIASGFCAYLWLRDYASKDTAIVCAIFYMAVPYHFGADLLARFSYAECWSFVWLPLIMLASRPDSLTGGNSFYRTCVLVAIPYALLSMTHLPTLLLFSAVPVVQAIVLPNRQQRVTHTAGVVCGMVLGFALAGIYAIPAWGDRLNISTVEVHTSGVSHYSHNFLLDPRRDVVDGAIDWFERGLDLWVCLFAALTIWCAFLLFNSKHPGKKDRLFWLVVSTFSILVSTPVAEFLWSGIPIIQIVEFPWRFGTVSTIAVTALLSLAIRTQHSSKNQSGLYMLMGSWRLTLSFFLSLVGFSVLTFWYTSNIYSYPIPWLAIGIGMCALLFAIAVGRLSTDRQHGSLFTTCLLAGFLVIANLPHIVPQLMWHLKSLQHQTTEPSTVGADMKQQLDSKFDSWEYRTQFVRKENFNHQHINQIKQSTPLVVITQGSGTATVKDISARKTSIEVIATTPIVVQLTRYYYPGLMLFDTQGSVIGEVSPSPQEGLIVAKLPAGRYQATMVLTKSTNEKLGILVSGIALCLLIYLANKAGLLRRRHALTNNI